MPEREWIPRSEALAVLGATEYRMAGLRRSGGARYKRDGARSFYSREDIERILEDGRSYVTTEDIAHSLGVRRRTVSGWIRSGALAAEKEGRRWKISREAAERLAGAKAFRCWRSPQVVDGYCTRPYFIRETGMPAGTLGSLISSGMIEAARENGRTLVPTRLIPEYRDKYAIKNSYNMMNVTEASKLLRVEWHDLLEAAKKLGIRTIKAPPDRLLEAADVYRLAFRLGRFIYRDVSYLPDTGGLYRSAATMAVRAPELLGEMLATFSVEQLSDNADVLKKVCASVDKLDDGYARKFSQIAAQLIEMDLIRDCGTFIGRASAMGAKTLESYVDYAASRDNYAEKSVRKFRSASRAHPIQV